MTNRFPLQLFCSTAFTVTLGCALAVLGCDPSPTVFHVEYPSPVPHNSGRIEREVVCPPGVFRLGGAQFHAVRTESGIEVQSDATNPRGTCDSLERMQCSIDASDATLTEQSDGSVDFSWSARSLRAEPRYDRSIQERPVDAPATGYEVYERGELVAAINMVDGPGRFSIFDGRPDEEVLETALALLLARYETRRCESLPAP